MDVYDPATLRAIEEAKSLVSKGRFADVPVDLHALASYLGVASVRPAMMKADGYLAVDALGGRIIRYRESHSPARIRFTIAHEIGHILLASASSTPLETQVNRAGRANSVQERAANRIASEILLPERIVDKALSARHEGWKTLDRLRHICQVSLSAAAFRMLEIGSVIATLARIWRLRPGKATLVSKFSYTEGLEVALAQTEHTTVNRLVRNQIDGRPGLIPVVFENCPYKLRADGRVRRLPTERSGVRNEYWVIGWASRIGGREQAEAADED